MTQRLDSIIQTRGDVTFPDFTGERVYMVPFLKKEGLPSGLNRWQPTVDAMLDEIDSDVPMYLMIDQGIIQAGLTHRRPGLHIDGYWDPGYVNSDGKNILTGRGWTPLHTPLPRHKAAPSHQPLPRHSPVPNHQPAPRHRGDFGSWSSSNFDHPEGIILASSVSAARGYVGSYNGPVGEMGDCSHVDLSGLEEVSMNHSQVYAGNVCCLHESIPVMMETRRTLVRLNLPGWTPS